MEREVDDTVESEEMIVVCEAGIPRFLVWFGDGVKDCLEDLFVQNLASFLYE